MPYKSYTTYLTNYTGFISRHQLFKALRVATHIQMLMDKSNFKKPGRAGLWTERTLVKKSMQLLMNIVKLTNVQMLNTFCYALVYIAMYMRSLYVCAQLLYIHMYVRIYLCTYMYVCMYVHMQLIHMQLLTHKLKAKPKKFSIRFFHYVISLMATDLLLSRFISASYI